MPHQNNQIGFWVLSVYSSTAPVLFDPEAQWKGRVQSTKQKRKDERGSGTPWFCWAMVNSTRKPCPWNERQELKQAHSRKCIGLFILWLCLCVRILRGILPLPFPPSVFMTPSETCGYLYAAASLCLNSSDAAGAHSSIILGVLSSSVPIQRYQLRIQETLWACCLSSVFIKLLWLPLMVC